MPKYVKPDGRKRRYSPDEVPRRPFRITRMWDVHHEIARRLVIGEKTKQIAQALNVTEMTVRNTANSPVVRDQIALLQAARDVKCIDVAREIQDTAPKALALLQDIISGEGPGETASINLRAHTARDMLDRAGHGAVKRFQGELAHGLFTAGDIEELKKRSNRR